MALETGTLAEGILTPVEQIWGHISKVGKDLEGYKKDPMGPEMTSIINHN